MSAAVSACCCECLFLVKAYMAEALENLRSWEFWKAAVAELIGTWFLVLLGTAATVQVWNTGPLTSVVRIALTFGLVLAGVITVIGEVSGGHVNPAVTLAAILTGQLSLARGIVYVIFQCIGAIIGSGLLRGVTPKKVGIPFGLTLVSPEIDGGQAFGVEFLATFFFVTVILASTDKRRNSSIPPPLVIGLALAAVHLAFLPHTGCSVNPARSFGPAVITKYWNKHWVYWLGPLCGAATAAFTYEHFFFARPVRISQARVQSLFLRRGPRPGRDQPPAAAAVQTEGTPPLSMEELKVLNANDAQQEEQGRQEIA